MVFRTIAHYVRLSVIMLSVVMMNVIMLSVVMMNVILLSVMAPELKLVDKVLERNTYLDIKLACFGY